MFLFHPLRCRARRLQLARLFRQVVFWIYGFPSRGWKSFWLLAREQWDHENLLSSEPILLISLTPPHHRVVWPSSFVPAQSYIKMEEGREKMRWITKSASCFFLLCVCVLLLVDRLRLTMNNPINNVDTMRQSWGRGHRDGWRQCTDWRQRDKITITPNTSFTCKEKNLSLRVLPLVPCCLFLHFQTFPHKSKSNTVPLTVADLDKLADRNQTRALFVFSLFRVALSGDYGGLEPHLKGHDPAQPLHVSGLRLTRRHVQPVHSPTGHFSS